MVDLEVIANGTISSAPGISATRREGSTATLPVRLLDFSAMLGSLGPFGERHLRRTLAAFIEHDHHERHHQGLGNELIDGASPMRGAHGVRRRRRLGGLLNYYDRAALGAPWALRRFGPVVGLRAARPSIRPPDDQPQRYRTPRLCQVARPVIDPTRSRHAPVGADSRRRTPHRDPVWTFPAATAAWARSGRHQRSVDRPASGQRP